jgi:hypothetical protein
VVNLHETFLTCASIQHDPHAAAAAGSSCTAHLSHHQQLPSWVTHVPTFCQSPGTHRCCCGTAAAPSFSCVALQLTLSTHACTCGCCCYRCLCCTSLTCIAGQHTNSTHAHVCDRCCCRCYCCCCCTTFLLPVLTLRCSPTPLSSPLCLAWQCTLSAHAPNCACDCGTAAASMFAAAAGTPFHCMAAY